MTDKEKTAYCGIYCPDCIHLNNEYSVLARKLKKHLSEIEFAEYARIKSPFGNDFQHWDKFIEVLDILAGTQCASPCRPGGGCSGIPCSIMECCREKSFEGCWECDEVEDCRKFDFLEPRCGQSPKNNIREIRSSGRDGFADRRHSLYIWQK